MNCHLLEQNELRPDSIKALETIEEYVQSERLDVFLARCSKCGLLYIGCYREIVWLGSDHYWCFWAPVDSSELPEFKAHPGRAVEMIQAKPHITWHPSGRLYWSDRPEMALTM